MSDSELGSSAFVVLGLAMQHDEITPYDLKQRIATSVGYFWSYSHPQIYQVTKKLQQLGLLKVRQETTGRRRKLYKVTAAGKKAFGKWMLEAVDNHMELRDLAILKLYFGEFAGKDSLLALARTQQAAHSERRRVYEQIPRERHVNEFAAMTLELGIEFEKQAARFWSKVEKKL
ncbi:MAG: DNA-binding PadR family transcriptional regulator [Candidatus Azotimanducaceae bacterium]|jgi:DNA-binding PadR family transcriptional regulator